MKHAWWLRWSFLPLLILGSQAKAADAGAIPGAAVQTRIARVEQGVSTRIVVKGAAGSGRGVTSALPPWMRVGIPGQEQKRGAPVASLDVACVLVPAAFAAEVVLLLPQVPCFAANDQFPSSGIGCGTSGTATGAANPSMSASGRQLPSVGQGVGMFIGGWSGCPPLAGRGWRE
ncbi:hypothetical protein SAMN04487782_0133 [Stenotrophomonas maltophilia]|nr:hypothetical protein SAMN04487782_0133 [Stenotrophomonas maltophilia]